MNFRALFLLALGGCSSVPPAELAWQTLHAVDVAQTIQIAKSECYWEDDPVTSALIGENPSAGEAAAWGIGWAGLHLGVTTLLERADAPAWLQATWQVLTIGNTAYIIKNNHDQGIHPWGAEC